MVDRKRSQRRAEFATAPIGTSCPDALVKSCVIQLWSERRETRISFASR